jgi:hypothetical protein
VSLARAVARVQWTEPFLDGSGRSQVTRRLSPARRRTVAGSIGAAVVLALALVLGGLWFSSAGKAHDDALSLWESKEPAAYSFDFSYCGGMCDYCPTRVTVERGEVVAVEPAEPGGCAGYDRHDAPTIEDVFAMEEEGREDEMTDSFEIRYDPTWGFPASVSLSCPEGTADCGTGFGVTNFRAES